MKKTLILLTLIAAVSCGQAARQTINVVPFPNQVEMKSGTFEAAGAGFHCSPEMDQASRTAVERFRSDLSLTSGKESSICCNDGSRGFVFETDTALAPEAYTLTISRKSVNIKASGLNGFNYALQTLRQMLPVAIFGKTEVPDADWTLPCVEIKDEPRFGYRGMHLDVSRHFFDMDAVKRYLDIMEVHKLNTLHWHLTDDQGWRLEIKKYPRLTEVGSIRNKTIKGHIYKDTGFDNTRYGEGCWFSQEQVKEIIAYAAAKGVTIIPEIDLPGHMLAALAAYPELGCTGGPYEVWGLWGVADDVLCVGKDKTMRFLEDVLTEVCELFPSEYIHIGGDECPKVRWEKCRHCQAKIAALGFKDDDKHKAEHYLQSYVTAHMEKFLAEKGKKLIGWDEILEGEVAPNATVMSWRGESGGIQAVRMGHDAIMTPNTFFYLDYYQSLDKANEPLAIGGYLPVEKCYSYEPFIAGMTDEEKSHILGIQANLWTEYIETEEHLQYMLLPRMAALSEVQWCSSDNKDYDRFVDSSPHLAAIYDEMGYNYAKHILHARSSVLTEDGCVKVKLSAPGGIPVRYTLDGSMPTAESPLYEAPIVINGSCVVSAVAETFPEKVMKMEFTGHKALGKVFDVHTKTHRNYSKPLPYNLSDGIRGNQAFSGPEWAGWHGTDFSASIDMGGEKCSSITLGTLSVKNDFIFNPTFISVSVSEDGENFTEIARKEIPVETANIPDGIKDYTVAFEERSVSHLKIEAGCVKVLPDWHPGKGARGFLFIDEVIVR
ncbi:MAG: family 20 glycosylhydrolase [Bacteroidales bacterium]|nr:family 20 glycosylhydrolase [Bacteroidales bacterium]